MTDVVQSRFVRPETVTLPLSDGDTITVKKRLNYGEKREAFGRMYLASADGQLTRHPVLYGIYLVCAYLLDWTLVDAAGQPVVIAGVPLEQLQAAVDALDPDDFEEILGAIETHKVAMTREREAAKKNRAGATASAATSPSPSDVAGPLTLSEA